MIGAPAPSKNPGDAAEKKEEPVAAAVVEGEDGEEKKEAAVRIDDENPQFYFEDETITKMNQNAENSDVGEDNEGEADAG